MFTALKLGPQKFKGKSSVIKDLELQGDHAPQDPLQVWPRRIMDNENPPTEQSQDHGDQRTRNFPTESSLEQGTSPTSRAHSAGVAKFHNY